MTDKFILQGHIPIPCEDIFIWGRWLEENRKSKIVSQETIGHYFVSTVFLGLDHRYNDGPPLLFETMIFDDREKTKIGTSGDIGYQERCSTWEQALEMHERAKAFAELRLNENPK